MSQLWALPTICPACQQHVTTLHKTTLHKSGATAYCANQTSVETEEVCND